MDLAMFEDMRCLEKTLGPSRLAETMLKAAPGWISDRSWKFWRGRLTLATGKAIPGYAAAETPDRQAGEDAWEGHHMTKSAKKKKTGKIGSAFDNFLKQEGIYEGVTPRAIKRVLARQLDDLMKREDISKTELASRMKTSRAQFNRLLDPENESVTLDTLARAARAVWAPVAHGVGVSLFGSAPLPKGS
jgi:antitoxin HicB